MNGKRFESALHPSRYQHAAVGFTMLTPTVKVAALRLAFLALVLGWIGEDVHRMGRLREGDSLPLA